MRAFLSFLSNPPTWVIYGSLIVCALGAATNPVNDFYFWNGLIGSVIWGHAAWQRDKFMGLLSVVKELLIMFSPFIVLAAVVYTIAFFNGAQ